MTQQEEQMLQDLAGRVNQTTLPDKDAEAEQYLQKSLGRNPDALYILAQTVLVQQYGLDQAKKQLEELRNQAPPPPPPQQHKSFLGSLLGSHDDAPPPPPQPQYGQPQYAPVPQYGQPQYAQPAYGQPQYAAPAQGGFLQSAMRTATGVAAGALAFEGIESLFHGFGGGGGRSDFGSFGGGGGGGREEVINNYYGDSGREHDGMSRDIEDRRDFADTGSDRDTADTDSFMDSSTSDSGDTMSDDGSSGTDYSDDGNS